MPFKVHFDFIFFNFALQFKFLSARWVMLFSFPLQDDFLIRVKAENIS